MAYVPDVNQTSEPTSGRPAGTAAAEFRAIKTKLQQIVAGAVIATAAGANAADITTYIRPDTNDRPAMVAGGWLPWNLNQQWGGAGCMPFHLVDSATGTEFKFDAFDAYIDNDAADAMGNLAGNAYKYQGITPAKNLSLQAVWLKLFKTLNPVDNVVVQLYSVAAGIPNALIATANNINGKQITSDSGGQWYRFAFAAVQALVAGTQYIIAVSRSGAIDVANCYQLMGKTTTRYPNNLHGSGTAVPAWTAVNGSTDSFICEAQASDQPIQTGGTFAGRIVGSGTGNPVNRSVGWIKPLREFFPLFDNNGWSILLRGKSWDKDRTISDVMYGLHHDRINIRSAVGTGFTTVTVYAKDGTVTTLVGTSDISGASYKDILITGRTLGDGGDSIRIWTGINGVWSKENELTAQTFSFDPLMRVQGHMWIMGGFPLFKAADYTKLSTMDVLPSADGWTFTTTTATVEGNVFAVSNGKLNQIRAGSAGGGGGASDGYYKKAAAGFNNANGSLATTKIRIGFSNNTKDTSDSVLRILDGTKGIAVNFKEYYTYVDDSVTVRAYPQFDAKTQDIMAILTSKGSDGFLFVNGRLIYDGTGLHTNATALNESHFGDGVTAAGENNDATWDYVGYYNTSNIYPQFTSGELHEFAVFSGDKNVLGGTLYNAGVPVSVKGYCGLTQNWIGEQVQQRYRHKGVTVNPTSTAVSPLWALMAEMEVFCLGASIDIRTYCRLYNSVAGNYSALDIFLDGVKPGNIGNTSTADSLAQSGGVSWDTGSHAVVLDGLQKYFGLHKAEMHFGDNAATTTQAEVSRHINVIARALR